MKNKKLEIYFLFDISYLNPAFISISSLSQMLTQESRSINLVFLKSSSNFGIDYNTVCSLLINFKDFLTDKYPHLKINLIELNSLVFNDYIPKYHFSNAILNKIILPHIFNETKHFLLLDCGLIFGNRINNFIEEIEHDFNKTNAISAFCTPTALSVNDAHFLKKKKSNSLYPAAGILYFNSVLYKKLDLYNKIIYSYNSFRNVLEYAEQEILCNILNENELSSFKEIGTRKHIDMADANSWNNISNILNLYKSNDFLYIKHVGSFKPWIKWILHPLKSIYLHENQKLHPSFRLDAFEAIYERNFLPDRIELLNLQISFLNEFFNHFNSEYNLN